MEPPSKRQRTGQLPTETHDDDDELFLEPEELNERRDPGLLLQQRRALAAKRLKSRFEDIFAKYERDFSGIGDEIDLRTGKVVVDNGHLESMENAKDTSDGDEDSHGRASEDRGRIAGEKKEKKAERPRTPDSVALNDARQVGPPLASWPQVSMAPPPYPYSMTPPPFFSTVYQESESVDPAWQTPELPPSAFSGNSAGSQGRYGAGKPSTTRKVVRKSLPVPEGSEADEEDVILEMTEDAPRNKLDESPLIKDKFPSYSSPKEESSLNTLTREVAGFVDEAPLKKGPEQPSIDSAKESERIKDGELQEIGQDVWDQSDLESYLDVTQSGINIPHGQILSVVIKSSKSSGKGTSGLGWVDPSRGGSSNITPVAEEDTPVEPGTRLSRDQAIENAVSGAQVSPISARKDAEQKKATKTQEIFQRNTIDPAYAFSDEDNLLPKKTRKARRQSVPAKVLAAKPSQDPQPSITKEKPSRNGTSRGRNFVDPSYIFSDEETLPPRRSKRSRQSEPAILTEASVEETSLACRESTRDPVAQAPMTVDVAKGASRERGFPRKHVSRESNSEIEAATIKKKTINSSAVVQQHEHQEHKECSTTAQSTTQAPVLALSTSRSGRQRQTKQAASPEVGDNPPAEALALASKPADQPEAEPQPPAAPPAAVRPQPSTPRSESKRAMRTPTASSRARLISLLSDDEDDEDEISFALSDFTPSGHHRILAHRHSPVSTSTSTTIKKKNTTRLAGLLFSNHKTKTPSSDERRRSSTHLARSVVKVRRQSRDVSPAGSVIQTPGGTKRRCGEGGYRCDRDFCFVCM